MTPPRVLILPGWQGSGPDHWQSRWQQQHGYTRVEQHDWQRPLRGDWTARLQDVLLADARPALLVAHSLGCLLAAWWAAHSSHTARVTGAVLVAPPEIERDDLRQTLPGWSPPARQRLPFRTIVVGSSDDPCACPAWTSQLAQDWGAALYHVGACGHINAVSALGDWDEGHALLRSLTSPANDTGD
jgi:predicted alpha/beta hydrolase family esterase